MFEAPHEARLEIHSGAIATLSETIPCEQLQVRGSVSIAR